MNFFGAIKTGFVWLGKELARAAVWVPKLLRLTDDVKNDAKTLIPEVGIVIDDVGKLALATVKDSGADIAAAETLVSAIAAAAAAKALNITADKAVIGAFEDFIAQVSNSSNYADILAGLKQLVLDYDTMGTSVKAALAKLKADA